MGRRNLLTVLPVIAAGLTASATRVAAQEAASPPGKRSDQTATSKTLVAFFSRTGNTRVIAGQIRRARDAALFEIKAAKPYPEDYEETVAQAARETSAGYLPPLGHFVADLRQYDTLYLGFPIWGMTAPPVIRSFLRGHDLSGKHVLPFITHGGYGLGDSMEVIRALAPAARVADPFSLEADQEKRTLQQVSGWLSA
jgi:flavodoxin